MCVKRVIMSLWVLFLFLSSISINTISAAACEKKPLIFNFGDSNSDTGGASALRGSPLDLPEGRSFFQQPTGRSCDGRLLIDFLCECVGSNHLSPYLQVFAADFPNGVNFALSGSDTIQPNPYVPFALGYQIAQFIQFRNVSIRRSLFNRVTLWMGWGAGAEQFENALYMFDIGQNDIAAFFDSSSFDQILHRIPTYIANITHAITRIYGVGGRNFWVHNTGPLGCLPYSVATRNASTPIDHYGCIAKRNEAALKLNSELESLCRRLRSDLPRATIVYVDVYSIKLDLIVNSTSYGFLGDPFKACYNKAEQSVCPEAEGRRYVSWDGAHYTEAANMLVASKILSTNFSTPPLPFNFFCT